MGLHLRGQVPVILSVSTAPRVLFAFPPAVPLQGEAEVTAYGWNLPGGREVEETKGPLEALTLRLSFSEGGAPAASGAYRRTTAWTRDAVEVRLPGLDCEPLLLERAGSSSLLEAEPNDTAATAAPLPGRCEVNGKRKSKAPVWTSPRSGALGG